jgi:hypothetical protein
MSDAATRQFVRARAEERCEYCRLPQWLSDKSFQIEHIVAQQHHLNDDPTNFALACDRCNLYKGPNLSSVDPDTLAIVLLYNPRKDIWSEHFCWDDVAIVGLTASGRATAKLLQFNAARRIALRRQLKEQGAEL